MTLNTSSNELKKLSFEDTHIAFASKNNFELQKAYWIFAIMNQNWFVKLGTFFIKLFLFLHFPIKKLIKTTIFQQFCGGESIDDCEKTITDEYWIFEKLDSQVHRKRDFPILDLINPILYNMGSLIWGRTPN
jgi:hypothetical protein